MALMFTDPDEGWQLECDECYDMLWSQRWLDAGSLVLEAEGEGWELEVCDKWDGVTYADAKCHECVEQNEDCNTCGDTGKWESTFEKAPTVLVDLGPCPDCNLEKQ